MSEPLQNFLEIIDEENVDNMLLNTSFAKNTLQKLEGLGKDIEGTIKDFVSSDKNPPPRPISITPTYEESAFLKPQRETTLYNVTNRENDVPVVEKVSKIFKKASFSVQGLSFKGSLKNNNEKYSVLAGEKIGFVYNRNDYLVNQEVKLDYNVTNQKTNLQYTYNTPSNTYRVSLFNQNGNNGLTAGYSNRRGFNSAFSVDEKSASLSLKYKKQNVELGGFATTDLNGNNPYFGVSGRIVL